MPALPSKLPGKHLDYSPSLLEPMPLSPMAKFVLTIVKADLHEQSHLQFKRQLPARRLSERVSGGRKIVLVNGRIVLTRLLDTH